MKQHKSMDEQRAGEILLSYGASPDAWPADERLALQSLLEQNPALQNIQAREHFLDQFIAHDKQSSQENTQKLADRIIVGLPDKHQSVKTNLFGIIADYLSIRTLVAAAAATIFAVSIMLSNLPVTPTLESDPLFEQWAWQDITNQELTGESVSTELGFMDLIELETSDG